MHAQSLVANSAHMEYDEAFCRWASHCRKAKWDIINYTLWLIGVDSHIKGRSESSILGRCGIRQDSIHGWGLYPSLLVVSKWSQIHFQGIYSLGIYNLGAQFPHFEYPCKGFCVECLLRTCSAWGLSSHFHSQVAKETMQWPAPMWNPASCHPEEVGWGWSVHQLSSKLASAWIHHTILHQGSVHKTNCGQFLLQ